MCAKETAAPVRTSRTRASVVAVLLALTSCTPLADLDERLDGGVDGGTDVGPPDAPDTGPPDPCGVESERPVIEVGSFVSGVGRILAESQTWVCTNVFLLKAGTTYVTGTSVVDVQPGTLIRAEPGAELIFQNGTRMDAVGTPEQPVVFRAVSSHWGGLYLLGDAPVAGDSRALGFGIAERVTYGGSDPAHDCGRFEYVRVVRGGQRGASLFFGACGTDTVVDHVQIHGAFDDQLEVRGGGADFRHIVLSNGDADGFRWDEGWRGTLQFAIMHHSPANDRAALDGQGPDPVERRSSMVASNLTMVGLNTDSETAVDLEAGNCQVFNSIVQGFRGVLNVSDTYLRDEGPDGIDVQNSLFFDPTDMFFVDEAFRGREFMNGNVVADPELPASATSVAGFTRDFQPHAASPAAAGGSETLPDGLEPTSYLGAIDPSGDDWTEGWVTFEAR